MRHKHHTIKHLVFILSWVFLPYVSTFHWTAGNQGEFAHHTPGTLHMHQLMSQLMPSKPGEAFCFKTPSPGPRSGPIALLSQSPDSCTAILRTRLTDQKKRELAYRQPQHRNTPFCKRIKKTGEKNPSIDAASARCCVDHGGVCARMSA